MQSSVEQLSLDEFHAIVEKLDAPDFAAKNTTKENIIIIKYFIYLMGNYKVYINKNLYTNLIKILFYL